MLPLLVEGKTLVHIVNKDNCDYGISDVILYKRGEQLVLHRIISKDGIAYITLGDNQYLPERVLENQVIGVMTAFIKDDKEIHRDDADYQKYVEKIVKMSTLRRRIMSYIRRVI